MGFTVEKNGRDIRQWPNGVLRYTVRQDDAELIHIFNQAWNRWLQAGVTGITKIKLDWNPNGPHTGILIVSRSNTTTETTVGYDRTINARHTMDFNPGYHGGHGDRIVNMVHEIGHVLGLYHEHQRPDAGVYIEVKCANLADYEAMRNNQGQAAMDAMCVDAFTAKRGGFDAGAEVLPFPAGAGTAHGPLDWDSVMLYSSTFGGKEVPSGGTEKKNVLKKRHGLVLTAFTAKSTPSNRDVDCVNYLYG